MKMSKRRERLQARQKQWEEAVSENRRKPRTTHHKPGSFNK